MNNYNKYKSQIMSTLALALICFMAFTPANKENSIPRFVDGKYSTADIKAYQKADSVFFADADFNSKNSRNAAMYELGCCDLPNGCEGGYSPYQCALEGGTFTFGGICTALGCFEVNLTCSGSVIGTPTTIPTTTLEDEPQQKENSVFELIPNPSKGEFTLLIKSGKKEYATVKLYDTKGDVVYKTTAFVIPSNYAIQISLPENLPAGVYFIQVSLGKEQWTDRVLIRRE